MLKTYKTPRIRQKEMSPIGGKRWIGIERDTRVNDSIVTNSLLMMTSFSAKDTSDSEKQKVFEVVQGGMENMTVEGRLEQLTMAGWLGVWETKTAEEHLQGVWGLSGVVGEGWTEAEWSVFIMSNCLPNSSFPTVKGTCKPFFTHSQGFTGARQMLIKIYNIVPIMQFCNYNLFIFTCPYNLSIRVGCQTENQ